MPRTRNTSRDDDNVGTAESILHAIVLGKVASNDLEMLSEFELIQVLILLPFDVRREWRCETSRLQHRGY